MSLRRIGATGITIRFVLLAISCLQYYLICPDSDFWHIGAMQQLARLDALRYDLSCCLQQFFISIRFVLLAISFLQYDLICPAAENSFLLQYDLSTLLRNLLI